jgi:hypothetical protein
VQVGLVEDDDRLHAALPRDRQIALDAAEVELGVEGGQEKNGVDVGGDHLFVAVFAGRAAAESRLARQHRQDVEARFAGAAGHRHPVADHGQLGARAGGVQEASAAFAHDFGGTGVQRTGVPEFADHAGRLQPGRGVRRESGGEVLVPPEVGKLHAAERNAAGGRVQASGRRSRAAKIRIFVGQRACSRSGWSCV